MVGGFTASLPSASRPAKAGLSGARPGKPGLFGAPGTAGFSGLQEGRNDRNDRNGKARPACGPDLPEMTSNARNGTSWCHFWHSLANPGARQEEIVRNGRNCQFLTTSLSKTTNASKIIMWRPVFFHRPPECQKWHPQGAISCHSAIPDNLPLYRARVRRELSEMTAFRCHFCNSLILKQWEIHHSWCAARRSLAFPVCTARRPN